MPAILAIVSEVLQAVLEILGIASVLQSGTNAIENFLGIHTGGPTLQQIYDQAHLANVNTLFISDVGTISLLDIHNQIAALSGQVAAYSPAATSVQIPPSPPAGYGGASGSTIATAVWSYLLEGTYATGQALLGAYLYAVNRSGVVGALLPGQPFMTVSANWAGNDTETALSPHAPLDTSTILPTDATPSAWVRRAYAGNGWYTNFYGATSYQDANTARNGAEWSLIMTQAEFDSIKATGSVGSVINVPPIWPGIAKATLSTSHALSDGLIITEPMDGVILELTSVAPPIQRIHYGIVEAYGHIGALSFGNDNGDQEAFQFISFANQVYCTLHNKSASSVVIKLRAGISGTATPWTVT